MAKSQVKSGGPSRGRQRVRKIGMGSGKYLQARLQERKGVGAAALQKKAEELGLTKKD